jgi:transposase-like protein
VTNLDKIRLLGEALYGERWRRAVARDLGVDPRIVQRWTSGEYEPNDGHLADLKAIASQRLTAIKDAMRSA